MQIVSQISLFLAFFSLSTEPVNAFLKKLTKQYIEVESIHRVKTEVIILATNSSLNEIQSVRSTIMNCAKRLNVTIKNLIIK